MRSASHLHKFPERAFPYALFYLSHLCEGDVEVVFGQELNSVFEQMGLIVGNVLLSNIKTEGQSYRQKELTPKDQKGIIYEKK